MMIEFNPSMLVDLETSTDPKVLALVKRVTELEEKIGIVRDALVAIDPDLDRLRDLIGWTGDDLTKAHRAHDSQPGEHFGAGAARQLLVATVRRLVLTVPYRPAADPTPGDLVVEVSSMRTAPDPDAIGWLVKVNGRDDIHVQSLGTTNVVRWENAEFLRCPDPIATLARKLFP
jgi:hypothetical protein